MDAITTRSTGFAEMAYVGEKPWHGQGQKLEAGLSIEQWQKAAGMDWRVCRSRVRFGSGENQQIMEDKHVLFRCDTKQPLGIVGHKYNIVQPGEILEFFRDLVNANDFELNTAGTLFGGRRFWALASIGAESFITERDAVKGFLLLSSSCDGSLATTAKETTVRVVCNNTLGMALSCKAKSDIVINHRSVFQADAVKDRLGLARNNFGAFIEAARRLAAKTITVEVASTFVEDLLVETKSISAGKPRETKQFQTVMQLWGGAGLGSDLNGSRGTLWGLVNGVTEAVDHRTKAKSASHQLDNALFGRGDVLKSKALEKALQLV
jgi:phage/plasmid-like protein (TIGR03299 family)